MIKSNGVTVPYNLVTSVVTSKNFVTFKVAATVTELLQFKKDIRLKVACCFYLKRK